MPPQSPTLKICKPAAASIRRLLTAEHIEALSHLTLTEAAAATLLSRTYFKRACRSLGVASWTSRRVTPEAVAAVAALAAQCEAVAHVEAAALAERKSGIRKASRGVAKLERRHSSVKRAADGMLASPETWPMLQEQNSADSAALDAALQGLDAITSRTIITAIPAGGSTGHCWRPQPSGTPPGLRAATGAGAPRPLVLQLIGVHEYSDDSEQEQKLEGESSDGESSVQSAAEPEPQPQWGDELVMSLSKEIAMVSGARAIPW